MTLKNRKLGEFWDLLQLVEADPKFQVIEVNSIADAIDAKSGNLVFIAQASYLADLANSSPAVVVVSQKIWDQVPESLKEKTLCLKSKDAMLAFAKTSHVFFHEPRGEGIHPTAQIHPTAKVGKNLIVGAFTTVGAGAVLGDNVVLYDRVSVGENTSLGDQCTLFPGVVIYPRMQIGKNVRIHANSVIGGDGFGYTQEKLTTGLVKHSKIAHMGIVRIGNDVEIGACASIDRGTIGDTIIEDGCIIDNQVQIGHNCHIELGAVICGCAGLAGSARVGKYAVVGGLVGVANKIHIGDGAIVAGFCGLGSNIPSREIWGGWLARPHRESKKIQVMISQLPEIFSLFKKLKKEEEKEVS